ncbi:MULTISPECIES: ABC transporter ATP-binding protein [Thiothrix]|jgi:simple sugar transport system ATP-binding protein|uniref:ABC transporter ATP-binding protein n=1 Tax=Thiothrix TaxID=1030 RepID=UPI0027E55016|nr:ABC transporter ATP-binding protein [Thiothrix lacustris]WMP18845.1 ABC transporter ATP-binding protein [Thiothrix lacustris]
MMTIPPAAPVPPRLELRGISKIYPSVIANQDVDLKVMPGEIHALLGENGAGKSTLMKVVYGVTKADAGEVFWDGKPVQIHSPAQARSLGIGMVFQHFSLFDTLTVVENVALAMDEKQDMAQLARQIAEVSKRYGLPLEPERPVHGLSVGERQRVEIVRCLLQNPRLLIMDEPTSVLTPQAVRKLFETLRRLADEGCSILYISHKLDEIRELCHTATVLRNGRVTGSADPRQESAKSLAELMIGKELPACQHGMAREAGAARLVVSQLTRQSADPFGTDLQNIDLSVNAGEIFGIAGVSGNGQQELLYAISGEKPSRQADDILLNGQPAGRMNPAQRRAAGLRFIPEERLGRGAVPDMSLNLNALLTGYEAGLSRFGFIRQRQIRAFVSDCITRFNVKCSGPEAEAKSLSGGNAQKFIVGRELLLKPQVLVVSQPTWGVDVGAASFIRQTLLDLRDSGVAILVVSEELDELFEICDRIAVIAGGKLFPSRAIAATSIEEIGLWMGGSQQQELAHEGI